MKSPKLHWEDPPKPVGVRVDWDKELKPLSKKRGAWARITVDRPQRIIALVALLNDRYDDFEFVWVPVNRSAAALYGRAVDESGN